MRLFPPVPAMGRTLATPTEIDGHKLPAGTSLAASVFTAHHHPDFWENPMVGEHYRVLTYLHAV